MITLPNGYSFDFVAASGALGFEGRGYLWERPLVWAGLLDPSQFAVITKTLTYHARAGNLRWKAPWRCTRLIPGGACNAVGLSNPGLEAWFDRYHPWLLRNGKKVILSIAPQTGFEAMQMAFRIAKAMSQAIVGVEVNCNCPNVYRDFNADRVCRMVHCVAEGCNRPVLVKLGWQDAYLEICKALDDGTVAAFDLINTIPWGKVFPGKPSPLAKYGLEGGVSGEAITARSLEVLRRVKEAGIRTPIISGGGVVGMKDINRRFDLGADAVALGTMFLRAPWKPTQLVRQWRRDHANRSTPLV